MAFAALRATLSLDSEGMQSGVDEAEDSLDDLESKAESAGSRMQSLGTKMTAGLTLPLAGMAAQSARTAAGFEQSMSEATAVMDDVDEAMEEKLEQSARDVATTTTASAEDAAESLFFLSSAGLSASESMEIMPDVANFAEAGMLDMSRAADIATNVTAAFGREIQETEEVMDVLVGTNQRHNQSVEDMSEAMSNVAPVAGGLGMEIEAVSAAVGALGDQGFSGAEAGTALNTVMSQMADESGPAAQGMEEMGVSVRDAEGDMRPIVDIIGEFEEAGADAGDMAELFGTRGGPAMSSLLQQGSDELEDYTNELENTEGATEDTADEMRDNFNAELGMARDQLADAGITIGQDLLPYLGILVNTVSGAADAFGDLSSNQQTAIVAIGGLIAIGGPALVVMGMLVSNAVAVAGAFGTAAGAATWAGGAISGALLPASMAGSGGLLTLAASAVTAQVALGPITVPIYAIVGAIGALLAAVVGFAAAYRKSWMGVRDTTEWVIDPILSGIDMFIESIFGISDATESVASGFEDFLSWILDAVNKLPGVDIGGDGIGFDFDTDMDGTDTGDLGDEMGMEADDMMPDDLDEHVEEDVAAGAENGMVEGIIDGLEESDVKDQLKTEIQEAQDEIDEISAGATGVEGWEEVDELESEIADFEEQIEHLEDGGDIQDIDMDIVAQVAEDDLEAEEQRMAWEAELAETLGEDYEMDFDRDESIGELDQQLQEELEQDLKTQEDQYDLLEKIQELMKSMKTAMLEDEELELTGELDISGDVASMEDVEGRLDREARRGSIQ